MAKGCVLRASTQELVGTVVKRFTTLRIFKALTQPCSEATDGEI
jgi:hypothetical protein